MGSTSPCRGDPVAHGQQRQRGRRVLLEGRQFYYVRGIGLLRDRKDIGNIVLASHNGAPVRVKDVGEVVIGHAPRLGEFGFQKDNDDAVEGVILMRRGEQTQNVLKGSRRKPRS